MTNIKKRNTYYHSKLNKNLCFYLILNCLIHFLYSGKALNLDIEMLSNFVIFTKGMFFDFTYNAEMFSLINFALITFIAIKVLFSAKKIPFILITVLLFILSIDYNISDLIFGGKKLYTHNFLNDLYSNEFMYNTFFKNNHPLENLNYLVISFILIYTYVKIATWDKIQFNQKAPKRSNSGSTAPSNRKVYLSERSSNDNNYDDYNSSNKFFNSPIFRIFNDDDKRNVYDRRHTNHYDKVIDENGAERYVWEYADEYERNMRYEEEQNRIMEEQNYYNYNNNDSYNYSPYDDNSYGGNDWTSNTYNDNNSWY